MRKVFIASVGTLLVLFLATSGYPAQGAAAVQASGDITLHFGIQHEFDFEVRDNYDLDNGLSDDCAQADCSGLASTPFSVGEKPNGFVEQETRLIIQGSQGDIWKARFVSEWEEVWEGDPFIHIERAWADIKLYDTPVHVKLGLIWDQWDPFRLVYSDDDMMVKVYATHGNISWAVWYISEEEVADNGVDSAGRDGDLEYYLARVDLDFGSFQVSPAIGFYRGRKTTDDARFARGLRGDFTTAGVTAFNSNPTDFCAGTARGNANCSVSQDETIIYPGIIAKGTFGPVSFVGEFFAALGEIGDDSAVDAQREQDVSAFMLAVDVGVKLGAWTPHAGVIWMSGDDNPQDNDAEAWAPIQADNENLLGTRGILMDDSVDVLGLNDDDLTSHGVLTGPRTYGLNPGMIAAFVGLKGRPTKKIKTDLNLVYFQWDTEKQWEYLDGMIRRGTCTPSPALSEAGVCSNGTFTNGTAGNIENDTDGLVTTVDDEVGWELNGAVTYSYNKHVTLTMSAAVFWPGDGAEVVGQCINAIDSLGADSAPAHIGSPITGCNPEGDITNERADDEAFNIEVELIVQF